ncbi:ATP-binding cassette domain-containing protein [Altererythrobacter xixiisoli]|uniref:ATP-binding cassette domain-containing protein n=1 Tax=Croceibacterium xixiisoli TaxID=1476466 RepID=A0A6I4TRB8_9SPHN|nr:ATP-binding cassette domain-containing protein [Croceibacterium xixiisoli]MXO97671.1 ATP-binding cassette domain-containing protein [Croceibacterium xixiisoli]
MSALLTIDSLSVTTPEGTRLFSDLSLSLSAGERVGLVGRNGSGKSTLLRQIAGQGLPAAGSIACSGTVGLLRQDWPEDLSAADALGLAEPLAVLDRITQGAGSAADFDAADWTLEARIAATLDRLGLAADGLLTRPIDSFSGGERMRLGLAGLIIAQPDLLLLDEPTNNLDAAGRAMVQAVLAEWPGAVLIASHDRTLLETMDRIVEITPIGTHIVSGGWSEFAALRDARLARAEQERDRAQTALRGEQRDAQYRREAKDRRDKAGRAFAAKKSEPRILLGRMAERAENSGAQGERTSTRLLEEAEARSDAARARVEVIAPLTMHLPSAQVPSGAALLTLDDVTIAAGKGASQNGLAVEEPGRLLGPWSFALRGAERVALTGPNGAGKSTLLRLAAGQAQADGGRLQRAEGRIALLDQHVGLLDPAHSIVANFRRLHPDLDAEAAHAACARFAFRNRDALQLVGTLSGGERLRAGLACAMGGAHPPWLLMLDEPTNHLDLAAIEALEAALAEYDGGLLIVSHDPAFLAAIGITSEWALAC